VVFSTLGVAKARTYLGRPLPTKFTEEKPVKVDGVEERAYGDEMRRELQTLMWDHVGIVRRLDELNCVLLGYRKWRRGLNESTGMGSTAVSLSYGTWSPLPSSLLRQPRIGERAGYHYLAEYPTRDDGNWLKHIVFEDDRVEII